MRTQDHGQTDSDRRRLGVYPPDAELHPKSAGTRWTRAADRQGRPGKAQSKSYSLVFTDQNMPNMDGLSLIRSLRNLAGYRSVPILMLTTGIERRDEAAGDAALAPPAGW